MSAPGPGSAGDPDPLTVVVSHPVRLEHEPEFLAWQERMNAAQRAQPGFRGSRLYHPVPGVQESWTTVFSFDTAEHLDGWLDSPERAALLAAGRHFQDFDLRRLVTPFGSWFSFEDGGPDSAPPSWKTALSVLVGLYPTVVLLTLGIKAVWPDAPLWSSLLLGTVLSVSLLTWVVMPIVTRALGFWLAPAAAGERLNVLGGFVSIAFLTAAATLFWLVTRVIWTLP